MNPMDQELMNEVKNGRVKRLGVLFERHERRLFNFCLRMTGDREASEDLVQEVFMRILKYRHTYRSDSDFTVWTYQMARNACHDHFRRHGRRAEVGREPPEMASPAATPSEEVEASEEIALLHRALAELPVEKREVLVLGRFRELKYEQVAKLLGCSVGAVKVRMHRAVKELRDVYHRLLEAPPGGGIEEVTS